MMRLINSLPLLGIIASSGDSWVSSTSRAEAASWSASRLGTATSRAQLQQVALGVVLRGLVEAARVGEEAEVADLKQAIEPFAVFALPHLGQPERGQNATVQVAKYQIGCHLS